MTATLAFAAELCRLYLVLLFGTACIGKARDMGGFRALLEQLFGLSHGQGSALALATVAAEGATTLTLAAGEPWRRPGAAAAGVLLCVVTAVIVSAMVRGTAVRCNCFGGSGHLATGWDVGRNAVSVAACAVTFLISPPAHLAAGPHLLLLGNALILLLIAANADMLAAPAR